MSVAFIDGPAVTKFVNDSEEFEKCITQRFESLDVNHDGVLSRDELINRISNQSPLEYELQAKDEINSLYDTLFDKFDTAKKGSIDREEFSLLMKEIMLAKANGIGNTPVSIILQEDSLLRRVVERESITK